LVVKTRNKRARSDNGSTGALQASGEGSIPFGSTKIMRFYAVSTGTYDDYRECYIQADCPHVAAVQFLKSQPLSHSEIGTVWEAAIDTNGVLRKTIELCDVELPGSRGYLWNEEYNRKFHAAADVICCYLCGDLPGSEPINQFLNADHKCPRCAKLKQLKI
jgi:phage FluMu protein Com